MTDMNPCLFCDCYDSDTESCTMPSSDRLYACPLEGVLQYDRTEHFMDEVNRKNDYN